MLGSPLSYQAGDIRAKGVLYRPGPGSGQRLPGVVLVHEGPGLGDHARLRAGMLAEEGYVVLAADLHGEGHVASSHAETLALVSALLDDRPRLLARTRSALEALVTLDEVDAGRTAAVGYCFGGLAVLDLARSGAPVNAVATFHGLLTPPAAPLASPSRPIRARLLACTGGRDHLVPPEQVLAFQQEMDAAGADWQVLVLGGARHAFTNALDAEKLRQLGFGYDRQADQRSWRATLDFLRDSLAAGDPG